MMKLLRRATSWLFRDTSAVNAPPVETRMFKLLQQAYDHYQANEPSSAEALALEALREPDASAFPNLKDYAINLLDFMWFTGESYEKGIVFFTEHLRQNPTDANVYGYRATNLWYNGDPSQALLDYSRVLELIPADQGALVGRGQVYVELSEPRKAIVDLTEVLDLINKVPNAREPNWSKTEAYARNGLGAAYGELRDFTRAFHEFELSITLQPENAWVYFNRAKARELAGDKTAAIDDYQKSLSYSKPKLAAYKRRFAELRVKELTSSS